MSVVNQKSGITIQKFHRRFTQNNRCQDKRTNFDRTVTGQEEEEEKEGEEATEAMSEAESRSVVTDLNSYNSCPSDEKISVKIEEGTVKELEGK